MGGEKTTRHLRMNHERNILRIIPATAGPSKQPQQCGKTGKQSLPGTTLPQRVLMLSYLQTVFTSVFNTHQGIKLHTVLCQSQCWALGDLSGAILDLKKL